MVGRKGVYIEESFEDKALEIRTNQSDGSGLFVQERHERIQSQYNKQKDARAKAIEAVATTPASCGDALNLLAGLGIHGFSGAGHEADANVINVSADAAESITTAAAADDSDTSEELEVLAPQDFFTTPMKVKGKAPSRPAASGQAASRPAAPGQAASRPAAFGQAANRPAASGQAGAASTASSQATSPAGTKGTKTKLKRADPSCAMDACTTQQQIQSQPNVQIHIDGRMQRLAESIQLIVDNNADTLKSMEWDKLIPSFGSKRSKQEDDDFKSLLKRFRRSNSLVIAEASAAIKRIDASAFKASPQLAAVSAELAMQKRKTSANTNLMRMVETQNPCIDDYLTAMKEAEEVGYYYMNGPTL